MKSTLLSIVVFSSITISSAMAGDIGSGGVAETYDGGYKNTEGNPIYIIKCNSGGSSSASQKSDGRWYDGSEYSHSDRYKGMSLSQFANEMCN